MAKDKEIKVTYTVINKQFNKALADIGNDVKKLNKEFSLQKEQMKLTASESAKYEASLKNLTQKYDLAKQKTETIKQALDNVKKLTGENSEETRKWSLKLLDAQKAEESLKNSISQTNDKLKQALKAESDASKASKARLDNLKGLSAEQDKIKLSSEKLSKEYALQVASLDKNASETDKLKLKIDYLKKEFDNSTQSVANLTKQLEIAKQEYGEGSREVDKLEKELLDAKIATSSFSKELDEAKTKMGGFTDRIISSGEKIKNFGSSYSKKVTAPILAGGALMVKTFDSVDAGADVVIKKTGATGKAAKELEEIYKNVLSSVPSSIDDVGNAVGEINTQFGFTGSELERNSILLLEYSRIADEDVTNATIHAKQAMEQFNLSSKDLPMILDSVAKTAQNTGVSTTKLFDGIIKGAPSLRAMGLDINESVSLLGMLAQSGIDSDKALVALNKAQVEFSKSGKSVKEGLKELIPEIRNAKTEQDAISKSAEIFGSKNGPAMAKAIREGKFSFDDLANSLKNSKGAVHDTFVGVVDEVDSANVAMNSFKVAGAELGSEILKALAPVLKEITVVIKELAEKFKNLDPSTKQMIVKAGLLVAAVGPVLVVLGSLISTVGGVIKVFGGAIKSISTLSGAWKVAFKGAEAGSKGVELLAKAFKVLPKIISPIRGIITKLFSGLSGVFARLIPAIGGVLQSLAGLIVANPVAAAVVVAVAALALIWFKYGDQIKAWLSKHWEEVKQGFSEGWKYLTEQLQQAWSDFLSDMKVLGDGLGNLFSDVWNSVSTTFTDGWNYLSGELQQAWSDFINDSKLLWSGFTSFFGDLWSGIKETTTSVWESVTTWLGDKWENLKTAAGNTWDRMKAAYSKYHEAKKQITESVETAISNYLSRTWNDVKTTADRHLTNLRSTFSSVYNQISSHTQQIWGSIRSSLTSVWNGLRSAVGPIFSSISSSIQNAWNAALRATSNVWNNIRNSVSNVIENIKGIVRNGLNAVSNFFSNLHLRLPHIKLPHFNISGYFSLDPPSIPHISVDWYKTGGIATGASIVGIGEAGNEAIVPLSGRYMSPFADAIADRIKAFNVGGNVINIVLNQDVKETADFRKGIGLIDRELRHRGYRLEYGRGGV